MYLTINLKFILLISFHIKKTETITCDIRVLGASNKEERNLLKDAGTHEPLQGCDVVLANKLSAQHGHEQCTPQYWVILCELVQ